ncbi:hypothetical protein UFOVP1290_519 [uncultured Caudovirales phage]|uniref:Uncharacterized protein n=1 Tax=uncultured Caudovirales phage TaxID=2100421 RepID=A0A6J5RJ15_9CAUD|nr:hypothetical protein UFOVP1290_519 [uncultured Caudovirales phage]
MIALIFGQLQMAQRFGMRNKLFSLFILISITIVGCPKNHESSPSPIVPTDTSYCESACRYLETLPGEDGKLGCLISRPLKMPDGKEVSCTQFCKEEQNAGRNLYPSCWLKVNACSEIESYRLQTNACDI